MANESAKGSKAGRVRDSEGHKRYNMNDRFRVNRLRRELKNLRTNPNDQECFNRLNRYITNKEIPVGYINGTPCMTAVRNAVDGFREVQLAA